MNDKQIDRYFERQRDDEKCGDVPTCKSYCRVDAECLAEYSRTSEQAFKCGRVGKPCGNAFECQWRL